MERIGIQRLKTWAKRGIVLAVLAFFSIATSPLRGDGQLRGESYPPKNLSEKDALEEVSLLRAALSRIHPGYERFATPEELASEWRSLEALAEGGTTDLDLYLATSRLLATLRCDHTKAEAPPALQEWREGHPAYLPAGLVFFGHRAFIAKGDPEQPDLQPGQEVLAIDGRSVAEMVDEIRPLLSVDGFTDATKDVEMGFSSEYQGAAIDHFGQLLWGFQESVRLTLAEPRFGKAGEAWAKAAEARTVKVRTVTYPRWLEIASQGAKRYVNFKDEVELSFPREGVALLRIGTFVNYRDPVNPRKVFEDIFRKVAEQDAHHLILDLRDNGGGSSEPPMELLRFLLPKPFVIRTAVLMKSISFEDLVPYLSTWEKKALHPKESWFEKTAEGWFALKPEVGGASALPVEPYSAGFRGPVSVLVGPGNASGSTHLIAKLEDSRRVRLVGGPTGGNPLGATAGLLFYLELPHSGIKVRIPTQRTLLAVSGFEDGRSLEPEVRVDETPATFFSDEDEVLAAALAAEVPASTTPSQ